MGLTDVIFPILLLYLFVGQHHRNWIHNINTRRWKHDDGPAFVSFIKGVFIPAVFSPFNTVIAFEQVHRDPFEEMVSVQFPKLPIATYALM